MALVMDIARLKIITYSAINTTGTFIVKKCGLKKASDRPVEQSRLSLSGVYEL
jgi:hypothetical protein